MPGPIKEDNGRRQVTCERCNYVWWVNYQEAVEAMQGGRMWIKHRQEREGETAFLPGTWKDVAYLSGLCYNCDHGITRPSVEWETAHIAQLVKKYRAAGVDPELVADYAIEEYAAEYGRTFQPEFQAWFEDNRPGIPVDLSLLPEEFKGEEIGWENGSPRCPHVNPPVDWTQFNNLVQP